MGQRQDICENHIQDFDKQIKELLDKRLIKNNASPYMSLTFMGRNHNEEKIEKVRILINYRKFNDNTIFDGYYIPNKIVILNRIRGASWFSKMDCKSGYWQIKMDEESIPLTAFSATQGHYEWTIMSFTLKNAPQIFQRRVQRS